jgi:L-malate glycosyltransferase
MIGGTETQAVELARRLDPSRYQVTIGCLRKEGPLLEKLEGSGIPIVHIDLGGGIDSPAGIRAVFRLAQLLRRGKFDILHAHDLWSNMVGTAAAMMARLPVRITSQRDLSHDFWYQTYRRRVLRFFQARSTVVLTNAGAIRDLLVSEKMIPAEKICVIYNGVDLQKLQQAVPDRETFFPNSSDKKLVVMVGNMVTDVKGHPTLIAAAKMVVAECPTTQFVLVGDGPRRPAFEAQVRAASLDPYFLFLGRRTDVPQILACCQIAVLPSLAEGLPNAVLEYMARGLPVVATALGGNLEVIQPNTTGLLVPAQNPGALAEALVKLLRDDQLARSLGSAARSYVEENFSFERLVANTDKLYSKLLQAAA